MNANPVLKPKLATPALVLVSVALLVCAVLILGTVFSAWPPPWVSAVMALAFLIATTIVGAIWMTRLHRLRTWATEAQAKWTDFDQARRRHGTTAEVTVLSVDTLEPTGSWITIKWNRFDHVQAAWLEALHEPIWPGSVLLISPDITQVGPGLPWPREYYIQASACIAWAPSHYKDALA